MAQMKSPDEIQPIEKMLYWLISLEENDIERILSKVIFTNSIKQFDRHMGDLSKLIFTEASKYNHYYYQKQVFENFIMTEPWEKSDIVIRLKNFSDFNMYYVFEKYVVSGLREWVLYEANLVDPMILELLEIPYKKELVAYFNDDVTQPTKFHFI